MPRACGGVRTEPNQCMHFLDSAGSFGLSLFCIAILHIHPSRQPSAEHITILTKFDVTHHQRQQAGCADPACISLLSPLSLRYSVCMCVCFWCERLLSEGRAAPSLRDAAHARWAGPLRVTRRRIVRHAAPRPSHARGAQEPDAPDARARSLGAPLAHDCLQAKTAPQQQPTTGLPVSPGASRIARHGERWTHARSIRRGSQRVARRHRPLGRAPPQTHRKWAFKGGSA